MGDRLPIRLFKRAEAPRTTSSNAATQVQTVADLTPTETIKKAEPEIKSEKDSSLSPVAEKDLVATFVSDVIEDGTVMAPNAVFEQTWFLRNDGSTAWPSGCSVKFVGGDNMCAVDPQHPASVHELVSAAESTVCYSPVAPGQDFGFTVLMRTPSRPGKVISYWRLTGPSGEKFGHKLWCDVRVEAPTAVKEEQESEQSEPQDVKSEVKPEIKEEEKSQMIFPKLEKESPTTSMYAENPAPATEDTSSVHEEFDELEDEDDFGEESEDGFLTDDEYDILDASDEEYLAEQGKAIKK
jgi:next-to-BRCA1 protein 1